MRQASVDVTWLLCVRPILLPGAQSAPFGCSFDVVFFLPARDCPHRHSSMLTSVLFVMIGQVDLVSGVWRVLTQTFCRLFPVCLPAQSKRSKYLEGFALSLSPSLSLSLSLSLCLCLSISSSPARSGSSSILSESRARSRKTPPRSLSLFLSLSPKEECLKERGIVGSHGILSCQINYLQRFSFLFWCGVFPCFHHSACCLLSGV